MTDTDVATHERPAIKPKGRGVVAWEGFEAELKQREQSIVAMLPGHVSRDRFISSAVAAVKQTPELLSCTPRSLFSAITKSAQDGLLPDGREGVITIYREKQKDDSWANVAQWNPMAWGLRKRARELDHIIVGTNVVYENDEFSREEGDNPKIVHKPAPFGTQRGAMVGAYAIYRKDADILHRETMDAAEIEKVRAQSKMPNGLMWTKFTTEAWRKTVLRRGFKSVPCSERLETILRRDDDMFNFDEPAGVVSGSTRAKPNVIQSSTNSGAKALPPVVGESQEEDAGVSDGDPKILPAAESAALAKALLAKLEKITAPDALEKWRVDAFASLDNMTAEDAETVRKGWQAKTESFADNSQAEADGTQ